MKTYNVNENINFTQFGITLRGTITRVVKPGYYEVAYGKHNSKTIVAEAEIEEGRFSALVTFIREGVKKTVELCGMESAMEYIYDVIEPNGWEFDTCTIGRRY